MNYFLLLTVFFAKSNIDILIEILILGGVVAGNTKTDREAIYKYTKFAYLFLDINVIHKSTIVDPQVYRYQDLKTSKKKATCLRGDSTWLMMYRFFLPIVVIIPIPNGLVSDCFCYVFVVLVDFVSFHSEFVPLKDLIKRSCLALDSTNQTMLPPDPLHRHSRY